jgi:GntR family transcriptional regulator
MKAMTDHQDQVPLVQLAKHRQIIEALALEIEQGRLKPSDRLPSEKELCQQWHASRSTTRKALAQLVAEGKIFSVQGKGSFVSSPKISHPTTQLLSFTEKMKAQGMVVETKLVCKELVDVNAEITASLKVAPPGRVWKIQRLRIVQGEPIALQSSFVLQWIGKLLSMAELETESLNPLIQRKCGIRLSRSDIWIEDPILSRIELRLLGNPRLSRALAIIGLTFNQDNEPVRFSRSVFRGDRVRLRISNSNVFGLDYPWSPL